MHDFVDGIKQRHGGVEAMRKKLGLTRKEICEQLFIDPSTWSRWVRYDKDTDQIIESAPPHAYKTMALLVENHKPKTSVEVPALVPKLTPTTHDEDSQRISLLESKLSDLSSQFETFKKEQQSENLKKEELTLGWKLFLLLNTVLLIYFVVAG